jgi:hypothetical protein
MNITKTISLIAVLAALAAYVYYYEIKGGEERENVKQEAKKLFNFENDSVTSLEIRSVLRQLYVERTADGWYLRNPVQTEGDESTVSTLLGNLKNLEQIRSFPVNQKELRDFGLVGRSLLIILTLNNAVRDSIWLGDRTPVGSNVFAKKSDSLVYTVTSVVKSNAEKDIFDWRDKSVTKIKQAEVREFKLRNSNGSFYLVRENGAWNIVSPKNVRAENVTVNTILRKIENGRIKSIAAESLEYPDVYRLARPAYEVDLYLGESKAHKKLIFSSLENNIAYGKDDSRPHVFAVDSLFLKDLNQSLYDLRYKKFAEVVKDLVDSVVVYQGDSVLTFHKDTSNTWFFRNYEPIKQWKMNSYLSFVNNLAAKAFLLENVKNPIQYSLSNPDRRVELYAKGNKIQELLLVSRPNDQKIAFCPNSKIVAEIEDLKYRNLEVKMSDWIDEQSQDPS